jgi:hypothetical protein
MNSTKWSYMDHWVTRTPQGSQPPSFNRPTWTTTSGSSPRSDSRGSRPFSSRSTSTRHVRVHPGFEKFLQDHGFEKIVSVFLAYPYATQYTAPHRQETHERIIADCVRILDSVKDLAVENFIVMPTALLPDRAGDR